MGSISAARVLLKTHETDLGQLGAVIAVIHWSRARRPRPGPRPSPRPSPSPSATSIPATTATHALPRRAGGRLCAIGKAKLAGSVLVEWAVRVGRLCKCSRGGAVGGLLAHADSGSVSGGRGGGEHNEGEEGGEESKAVVEYEHGGVSSRVGSRKCGGEPVSV